MDSRAVRASVLALLLLALLPGAGSATGDPGADKARVDARLAELRERVGRAQRVEGVLTTQLSAIGRRAQEAQAAVSAEEATLASLEASLRAEQARLRALQAKIATQTARLSVLERQYGSALRVLERHVRALYEADEPDIIGFALGATSFSDLLDNVDLLNRIGRQHEGIAAGLDDARIQLRRARAETGRARRAAARSTALVASRTQAQRDTRDRVAASRDELLQAEREKAVALRSVREDRASFLAEADGLAAQSAALAAQIAAAQGRAGAAEPSRGVADAPSAPPQSGGRLSWPVAGPITSGFGSRWGRMHQGLDFGVGEGTPVHAATAGTVIFAGWMSGYGNIVVLDHGSGMATAYAHNSRLLVGQGASVGRGNVIAFSGNTGHSTGPHVHFEVRLNGTPVDPLGYLG